MQKINIVNDSVCLKEENQVKRQNLINKMTLDEKAAFLSGKSEWESSGV